MTVKEFIEALQEMPEEVEVVVYHSGWETYTLATPVFTTKSKNGIETFRAINIQSVGLPIRPS